MRKISELKKYASVFLASLIGMAGCVYLSIGMVCGQNGDTCVPGVIISGALCTDGRPKPTWEDCGENEYPQEYRELNVLYGTNFGINMTSNSLWGKLEILKNGNKVGSVNVLVTTSGNKQTVSNLDQYQSQILAFINSPNSSYSYRLKPPSISVTTNAAQGQMVMLTAAADVNNVDIGAGMMSYAADEVGGPAQDSNPFGGGF